MMHKDTEQPVITSINQHEQQAQAARFSLRGDLTGPSSGSAPQGSATPEGSKHDTTVPGLFLAASQHLDYGHAGKNISALSHRSTSPAQPI